MDVERPRRAGERARRLDEPVVVQLIDVVLVHEDAIDGPAARVSAAGSGRWRTYIETPTAIPTRPARPNRGQRDDRRDAPVACSATARRPPTTGARNAVDEALLRREADDDAEHGRADAERDQGKRHHARATRARGRKVVIARLAVERHPQRARHVERGQDRGDDPDAAEDEVPVRERARRGSRPSTRSPRTAATPRARQPAMSIVQNVIGILRRSPPIFRMSCSSARPWITEPAPRNSSALKKACVTRWKIAATGRADPERQEHVAELADGRVRHAPA